MYILYVHLVFTLGKHTCTKSRQNRRQQKKLLCAGEQPWRKINVLVFHIYVSSQDELTMKHNCGNKDIALRLSCSTQDMLVAMKCGKLYNAMYIECT